MDTKSEYLVDLIFEKFKNYKRKKNLTRKRKFEEIYFFTL